MRVSEDASLAPLASRSQARAPTYTYDPNGNLTSKTEGSDTWGYEWNANNELTRVTKNSIEQARFAYDPLGRRVEKAAGGVTISYTYDDADILRDVRGATTLKYVHGPGVDEPLAMDDGAVSSYFHVDALGSIGKATNGLGAPALARHYDTWGNLEVGASEPGYAYTGREWDSETGLYFYRARYYDPRLGRFVSEDPVFLADSTNLFAYVANRPGRYRDPLGLEIYPHGVPEPPARPFGDPNGTMNCTQASFHGGVVALSVLFNKFSPERKNSDKVAHCLVYCELAKACGAQSGGSPPGYYKEVFDDVVGRTARGMGMNPARSRAARQTADPKDFQANQWGNTCPMNQSCFERCALADRRFR